MKKKEPTIEEVKKFYDEEHTKHQQKWLTRHNPRITALRDFATSQVMKHSPATMLDIGCGVGILTHEMVGMVPQITAIDLSDSNIESAKEYKSHKRITYLCGDFTRMYYNIPFDMVCAFDVVEHIRPSDREAFLVNAKDLCKGIMLVSIPNPEVILSLRKNDPDVLQIVDEPVYDKDFSMFTILKKLSVGKYIYYILKP